MNILRNNKLKLIVTFTLTTALCQPAYAGMPVTDATAIVKATEQLTAMEEQLSVLTDSKKALEDTAKTIGKLGKVTLPYTNLSKLKSQLKNDAQCLLPDLGDLMPSLEFEDMEFSICNQGDLYLDVLWTKPEILKGLSFEQQGIEKGKVLKRRQNILVDTVSNALAQSDSTQKNVDDLNNTADQIEQNTGNSEEVKQLLVNLSQGQAAMVRALAQQNQLMAQILRVNATTALNLGVPLSSDLVPVDEDQSAGS